MKRGRAIETDRDRQRERERERAVPGRFEKGIRVPS
jgi:hypothetical protein